MRIFVAMITVLFLSAATMQPFNAHAQERNFAVAGLEASAERIPNFSKQVLPKRNDLIRYAAACGLCTDEDCCGGTENGWRLCKSDCPEGQYKCMQVATCP